MKKIILLLVALPFCTGILFAQEKLAASAVPAAVKTGFNKVYPGAKVEYWTREEGNYVAEFDQGKKEMVAFFSPDGKPVKSESRIQPAELPKEAKAYITAHYPGKKITDAVTSIDHKGGRIYEAEVGETDLIFDANGKFLKSVKERPVN